MVRGCNLKPRVMQHGLRVGARHRQRHRQQPAPCWRDHVWGAAGAPQGRQSLANDRRAATPSLCKAAARPSAITVGMGAGVMCTRQTAGAGHGSAAALETGLHEATRVSMDMSGSPCSQPPAAAPPITAMGACCAVVRHALGPSVVRGQCSGLGGMKLWARRAAGSRLPARHVTEAPSPALVVQQAVAEIAPAPSTCKARPPETTGVPFGLILLSHSRKLGSCHRAPLKRGTAPAGAVGPLPACGGSQGAATVPDTLPLTHTGRSGASRWVSRTRIGRDCRCARRQCPERCDSATATRKATCCPLRSPPSRATPGTPPFNTLCSAGELPRRPRHDAPPCGGGARGAARRRHASAAAPETCTGAHQGAQQRHGQGGAPADRRDKDPG